MNDTDLISRPLIRLLAGKMARMGRIKRAVRLALSFEGGQALSRTAREILARYRGVEIGAWSYGDCFVPRAFDRGTKIGRFVSVAEGCTRHGRNHPLERVSLHPLFFNHKYGLVAEDNVEFASFSIESDAWLGRSTIITPSVRRIGLGSVVASGAVVTKDVPDFAIVGGNPAKLIRYRFDEATQDAIRESRWWDWSQAEIASRIDWFTEIASADAAKGVRSR